MSFHKPEFHETKSERKFYEDKKQKALSQLNLIVHKIKDFDTVTYDEFLSDFEDLHKLVNDI